MSKGRLSVTYKYNMNASPLVSHTLDHHNFCFFIIASFIHDLRLWCFTLGLSIPFHFRLVHHLRREASNRNDARKDDSLPNRMRNRATGTTGASPFSGTLLSAFGVWSTEPDTTRGQATTETCLEAAPHNVSKKASTLLLSDFGGIWIEATFFPHVPSTDIKGAAGTPKACQKANFEAQE